MAAFLKTPLQVGDKTLKSRVVMAPLTRMRGVNEETLAPGPLQVEYYGQRAYDGALLISEATVATPWSIASRAIPAIFNEEQALEWKKVVDAVHAKGGLWSQQLWFQGIFAHQSYRDHPLAKAANALVGASASATALDMVEIDYNTGERTPYAEKCHELTVDEIHQIQDQYVKAADYALNVAGADFIEIHAAHQYGFEQFCSGDRNQRTDEYGGSAENRVRFLKEVLDRLVPQYPGRVAIRISPHMNYNSLFPAADPEPTETFTAMVNLIRQYPLAYVLVTEPLMTVVQTDPTFKGVGWDGVRDDPGFGKPLQNIAYLKMFREVNKTTPVFGAGGFTPTKIDYYYSEQYQGTEEYKYDGIAMGRYYISNPDLVFRIENTLPLNLYHRKTFYTAPSIQETPEFKAFDQTLFPVGYTDYPTFAEVCAKHGFDMKEVMEDKEKMKALVDATQDDAYPLCSIEDIGVTSNTTERKAKLAAIAAKQ